MNEVLQATCLAAQLYQKLVRFPHSAHVIPCAAEHVGALPDDQCKDNSDCRIERRNGEQAPADGKYADETLRSEIEASPGAGPRQGGWLVAQRYQVEAHCV